MRFKTRKLISLLLSAIMLFFFIGVLAFADENISALDSAAIYAVSDKTEVVPGDTFTVTLKADNLAIDGSESAKGFQFRFDYDSTMLELTDKSNGELLKDAHTKAVNTKNEGQVGILASYADSISKSGNIVILTFTVKDSVSGEIEFAFANPQGAVSITFGDVPAIIAKTVSAPEITESASISVNSNLNVTLSGEVNTGSVYAALYRGGKVDKVKIYPASKNIDITFDSMKSGDIVKVMWWKENLKPMCEEQTVLIP